MQQLQQRTKTESEENHKKYRRTSQMNCEHCEKYFVDSADGLAVYWFHLILHGEIQ